MDQRSVRETAGMQGEEFVRKATAIHRQQHQRRQARSLQPESEDHFGPSPKNTKAT